MNGFKPLSSEVVCYKAKTRRDNCNKIFNNCHLPLAISISRTGSTFNLSLFSFSLLRDSSAVLFCRFMFILLGTHFFFFFFFPEAVDFCLLSLPEIFSYYLKYISLPHSKGVLQYMLVLLIQVSMSLNCPFVSSFSAIFWVIS